MSVFWCGSGIRKPLLRTLLNPQCHTVRGRAEFLWSRAGLKPCQCLEAESRSLRISDLGDHLFHQDKITISAARPRTVPSKLPLPCVPFKPIFHGFHPPPLVKVLVTDASGYPAAWFTKKYLDSGCSGTIAHCLIAPLFFRDCLQIEFKISSRTARQRVSTPSPTSPLSLTSSLPTPRVCPIFFRMLYYNCLAPRTHTDPIIPAVRGTTKSILNSASKHRSTRDPRLFGRGYSRRAQCRAFSPRR
jgi:hypothetical protein